MFIQLNYLAADLSRLTEKHVLVLRFESFYAFLRLFVVIENSENSRARTAHTSPEGFVSEHNLLDIVNPVELKSELKIV